MEAGKLRHRLVFQSKTVPETQDDFGGPVEDWTDDFSIYGAFQQVGSREFPIAHKRHAESTARFIIRYRSDLDTNTASDKYRVKFRSRYWNIYPPSSGDGQLISLEIEAREII